MSWRSYYLEHLVDMESLLGKLPKENATFVTSHVTGEPKAINRALAEQKEWFHNISLNNALVLGDAPYCRPEMQGHFRYSTIFACGDTRKPIEDGRSDYVPLYYHEYPKYVRNQLKPDVAILHVTRPDENGWCSFGTAVDYQMAAVETADLVVAQLNDQMPRTLGNCCVHVTDIDWMVEVSEPVPAIPPAIIGPLERAIGSNCASLIRDCDCLQLGIGAIPDAVLKQLSDKRDLGIHSEMLSDSVVDLMKANIITNRYKQLEKGRSVATFAMGTPGLYQFIHDNPGIFMAPVDYTNHPLVISQQENMVTVNSALQVDLMGQVAADTVGRFQYSGPGGQVDFVRGANMSKGGRNIIAMPSTAKGGTVSRITPLLSWGSGVTTNRFDVDYIVTEYGVARLWGKSLSQRAEALISIAHPDFREQLKAAYLGW